MLQTAESEQAMNITAFQKPFSRRTPAQWQQIINDQAISGLPQKAYCHQHGLSLATFCNWKKKLASHQHVDDTRSVSPTANDWLEVPPPENEPRDNRWNRELELPGGVTLRIRQA